MQRKGKEQLLRERERKWVVFIKVKHNIFLERVGGSYSKNKS